jgi:hypothetical protein
VTCLAEDLYGLTTPEDKEKTLPELRSSFPDFPILCPLLFQNKVVTVDGTRVKLQVRQEAGIGGGVEELAFDPHPEPQEACSPALSLG